MESVPLIKCECEHDNHFADCPDPWESTLYHWYGAKFPNFQVKQYRMAYGRFNLCPACANDCQKDYIIGEVNGTND